MISFAARIAVLKVVLVAIRLQPPVLHTSRRILGQGFGPVRPEHYSVHYGL